jgi:hypothetical protein
MIAKKRHTPRLLRNRRTYEFLIRYPHGTTAINGYRRAARHFKFHTLEDPTTVGTDTRAVCLSTRVLASSGRPRRYSTTHILQMTRSSSMTPKCGWHAIAVSIGSTMTGSIGTRNKMKVPWNVLAGSASSSNLGLVIA